MMRSISVVARSAVSKSLARAAPSVSAKKALPALVRGFATGRSGKRAVQVEEEEAEPAIVSLPEAKSALLEVLQEDVADLTTQPDEGLTEYAQQNGWALELNAETDQVTMDKKVGSYKVRVTFDSEFDERQEEEEQEEQEEPQQEGEEEYKMPQHHFTIEIVDEAKAGQNDFMGAQAYADPYGQIYVNAVYFSPLPEENPNDLLGMGQTEREASKKTIFLEDLSDQTQDKIFEFYESLGCDYKLAQFVQHYSQIIRTQNFLKKMDGFKSFLE